MTLTSFSSYNSRSYWGWTATLKFCYQQKELPSNEWIWFDKVSYLKRWDEGFVLEEMAVNDDDAVDFSRGHSWARSARLAYLVNATGVWLCTGDAGESVGKQTQRCKHNGSKRRIEVQREPSVGYQQRLHRKKRTTVRADEQQAAPQYKLPVQRQLAYNCNCNCCSWNYACPRRYKQRSAHARAHDPRGPKTTMAWLRAVQKPLWRHSWLSPEFALQGSSESRNLHSF